MKQNAERSDTFLFSLAVTTPSVTASYIYRLPRVLVYTPASAGCTRAFTR